MDMTFRSGIEKQLLAALATLKACIENCPKDQLNERHGDYPFSQVAFHALFYFDFYLSDSEAEFFAQDFHVRNKAIFDDYEELEYRLPVKVYTHPFLMEYVDHCKKKIGDMTRNATENSLKEDSVMWKGKISKMELYIYTLRHTQHHAAQLGLRVQFLTGKEMDWVGSGWK
jgi:hypothetical protein